ncbi:MAG TPA: pyrroline-5-carboxylate reductase [Bacillaceae bacterium]
MKISFIGAGSMAEAIIAGLIEKGISKSEDIYVTNRSDETKLAELAERYGIRPTYDTGELLEGANAIVFAVKPKDAEAALQKIAGRIHEHTLFISVMAGIPISFMEDVAGKDLAIARAMPNTSASIGKSATALSFNGNVTENHRQLAVTLFSSIGMTAIVEEQKLDAITALSGSGPAYFYYVVEAMERSAQEIGLESDTAKQLIIQTIMGAAEMLSTGKEAADLRIAITSPGGTTEAGIGVLKQKGVEDAFVQCIKAAAEQSKRLGSMYQTTK